MSFNLIQWLFTDPITAGNNTPRGVPEAFHFYILWLSICIAGILIPLYYSVEGRKRFVKTRPLIKYMLDRYLGWLSIICIIDFPLIFARAYLDGYFFAWRLWRYLWLASLVAWAITWLVYLIGKYPKERANMIAYQNRQKYIPKSNKRKAASSR